MKEVKDASMPSPHDKDEDGHSQYDIEDASRDLMKAEQHKQNPKLMAKVHKHLNGQKTAITSIQGLKQVANSKLKDMSADDMGGDEDQPKAHK